MAHLGALGALEEGQVLIREEARSLGKRWEGVTPVHAAGVPGLMQAAPVGDRSSSVGWPASPAPL